MTATLALLVLAGALGALAVPPPFVPNALLAAALLGALASLAFAHGAGAAARAGLAILSGFVVAAIPTAAQLHARWPEHRDGERALVRAQIVSIPVAEPQGMTFDADLAFDARNGDRRLRARVVSRTPAVRPVVGETWQLVIALRAPRGRLNAVGPDMERVWFRDGIAALGTVVPARLNRRVAGGGAPLDALRAATARRIHAGNYDRDAAALIAALAVGVTGAVTPEQWRVFNATGTTHLVAISGLHVTLFAVLAVAFARRLWRCAAGIPGVPAREPFAIALGLAAATGYALLAGFSVPTQRTLLMLAAWHLAQRLARARGLLHAMALALVLVLLSDPLAPLSSGFWLSFGAVAAILIVSGTRVARPGRVREAALVQGAVTLAVAPITLAIFGAISLASLGVNVVAIPVFTLVLVPLVLLATALLPLAPAAAAFGYEAAAKVYAWGWPALEAAANWPHALVQFEVPLMFYVLAAPAVIVALVPWPVRLRFTAAAAALPLVLGTARAPARGTLEIEAFEVGRGSAVLVRTNGYALLHGTGESFGTEGRVAMRLVVPALRQAHVAQLDLVIVPRLTHDSAAAVAVMAMHWPATVIATATAWPGATLAVRTCGELEPWRMERIAFRLDDACQLTVTHGAWRVELDARTLRIRRNRADAASALLVRTSQSGARRARAADLGEAAHTIDLARAGALRVVVDSSQAPLRVDARREGYPWPWRAPV